MKYLSLALAVVMASCSLFKSYTTRSFHYKAKDKTYTVLLQVPKGYTRQKTVTDSAGNAAQLYYYGDGSFLYAAHMADAVIYQSVDTSRNIPLPHPSSGLIYKGMRENGLFWREIRLSNGLVYGYGNVPKRNEIEFDRAVDFSSLRPVK